MVKVAGRRGERTVGMVVDAVSEVYNVAAGVSKPPPDVCGSIDTVFVKSLATVGEKLLILLDIDRLIDNSIVDEQPMAGAARPRRHEEEEARTSGGAAIIELGARTSIAQAVELHRALVTRLAAGGHLLIDGGRVEEIDTAILQMLASLWRSAHDRRLSCTWHRASDALRRSAQLVGLAGALGLQEAGTPVACDVAA